MAPWARYYPSSLFK